MLVYRMFFCLMLLLASTAAWGGSAAETRARAYLQHPDVVKLLEARLDQLLAADPDAKACTAADAPQLTDVFPVTPLDFDEAGVLTHGEIKTRWQYRSCALPSMNVWVVAIPGKAARAIGGLPGNSIGELLLQRDALMYAFMGAAAFIPPGCHYPQVVDTRFVRFEGPADPDAKGRIKRPWEEILSVEGCGARGDVTLHFIPDATGTTINVPGDPGTR